GHLFKNTESMPGTTPSRKPIVTASNAPTSEMRAPTIKRDSVPQQRLSVTRRWCQLGDARRWETSWVYGFTGAIQLAKTATTMMPKRTTPAIFAGSGWNVRFKRSIELLLLRLA